MKILRNGTKGFDFHFPIYNWLYPSFLLEGEVPSDKLGTSFLKNIDNSKIRARALYFHVPFCETICTFCPFEKSGFKNYDIVEDYVKALINEIRIKGQVSNIVSRPVEVIFFGGGTPSVLNPEQIYRIGKEIHKTFDTSMLKEFSFEIEVKSISNEKLLAMKEIGVTHGRFGLQTFNEKFRKIFNLTSTIDQVYKAIDMLDSTFENFSFDMIYGINGQTDKEFDDDIVKAASTVAKNVDFYPLNNYVSQISLHRAFAQNNLHLGSPLRKIEMNMYLRERLYGLGFRPHNGHGFFRTNDDAIRFDGLTQDYTFHYHKHVYGYDDRDIVGFGNSAVSILNGFTLVNEPNRTKYTSSLKSFCLDYSVGRHYQNASANKAVIMHLPYFGYVEKSKIEWENVYPETKADLNELIFNGFVNETDSMYYLTRDGWYWYVNLMYYLSPECEKRSLRNYIESVSREKGRIVEVGKIE